MTEKFVASVCPTLIGQRVQEPYGGTRGYITGFDGEEALVAWDDPHPVDGEVGNFKTDELRVVVDIRMDLDHWMNPALSPLVARVVRGVGITSFEFKDGHVAKGLHEARHHMLTFYRNRPNDPIAVV
jgi:hypothetical protein